MFPLETARELVTWGLAHGMSRGLLRSAARRGDLLARLTVDPELREDPFAAYEELRARGPVVHGRLIAGTVSHDVANQVLRSESFGVGAGHGELPRSMRWMLDKASDPYTLSPVDPPSMLAVDPPEHTRFRRLVSKAFTARSVASMEPRVVEVAERLLADLAQEASTEVDLVDRFASRLPVAVIADLLGIPAHLHSRLLKLGNEAAVTLDPGLSWRQYRRAVVAVRELHHWFEQHVRALRADPGEDLLSRLVTTADEDDGLTDTEVRATGLLLLGAGFETTVNLIGNAVALLDKYPEQRQVLRADPASWPNAVEEVLRFDSPVQLTVRQAYAEVELNGDHVAEGEAILVILGGANRDPAIFEDPHIFDVTRTGADRHLALSAGVHYCLGASLARLEAAVGLRLLYERFPHLRVDGTPRRRDTRVLRGFESLPVRLSARAVKSAG